MIVLPQSISQHIPIKVGRFMLAGLIYPKDANLASLPVAKSLTKLPSTTKHACR